MNNLNVVVNNDNTILKYATEHSAGIDICLTGVSECLCNSNLNDSKSVIGYMYNTGVFVEIPQGHFGMLVLRSSAAKRGYSLLNSAGIIDSDYRGELKAMITCTKHPIESIRDFSKPYLQLIIMPYTKCIITKVNSLNDSVRGTGGFGSTDALLQ
jgi:dUTP pyrophosphatase